MDFYFQTVLKKVEVILAGFDEAKHSIKLVGSKNSQVKSLLDNLEKDLNTLRNKNRRIQTNMNTPTSTVSAMDSLRTFELSLPYSWPGKSPWTLNVEVVEGLKAALNNFRVVEVLEFWFLARCVESFLQ